MKIKTIKAKVLNITVGRQQFKPYNYNLEPCNLFVEIPIDMELVASSFQDGVVLTLDGFSATLGIIADNIDTMHKQWEARQMGVRRG